VIRAEAPRWTGSPRTANGARLDVRQPASLGKGHFVIKTQPETSDPAAFRPRLGLNAFNLGSDTLAHYPHLPKATEIEANDAGSEVSQITRMVT
jgi:hypothetical protein